MQLNIYYMIPKKDNTWEKHIEIKKALKYAFDQAKKIEKELLIKELSNGYKNS